jgi:hypothetical protein
MGRACSTNWGGEDPCRLLMRKPEGKRQLGRRRRRWVDSIKMDLGDMGGSGVDWIGSAQERVLWELLWMRQWTFGVHKIVVSSWVATQLAASVVVLSSIGGVSLAVLINLWRTEYSFIYLWLYSRLLGLGRFFFFSCLMLCDRLCGLVVRVLGYRSGGPGSIPDTTRKKK